MEEQKPKYTLSNLPVTEMDTSPSLTRAIAFDLSNININLLFTIIMSICHYSFTSDVSSSGS